MPSHEQAGVQRLEAVALSRAACVVETFKAAGLELEHLYVGLFAAANILWAMLHMLLSHSDAHLGCAPSFCGVEVSNSV